MVEPAEVGGGRDYHGDELFVAEPVLNGLPPTDDLSVVPSVLNTTEEVLLALRDAARAVVAQCKQSPETSYRLAAEAINEVDSEDTSVLSTGCRELEQRQTTGPPGDINSGPRRTCTAVRPGSEWFDVGQDIARAETSMRGARQSAPKWRVHAIHHANANGLEMFNGLRGSAIEPPHADKELSNCLRRGVAGEIFTKKGLGVGEREKSMNFDKLIGYATFAVESTGGYVRYPAVSLAPAREAALEELFFSAALDSGAHDVRNAPWYVNAATGGARKNLVIALDYSASMNFVLSNEENNGGSVRRKYPDRWQPAVEAVMQTLDTLAPEDRFFLFLWDYYMKFSSYELLKADPTTVERVRQWLRWMPVPGNHDYNHQTGTDSKTAAGVALEVATLGRLREDAVNVHKLAERKKGNVYYTEHNSTFGPGGNTPPWIEKIRTSPTQPNPKFECLQAGDFCDVEVLFITDATQFTEAHRKAQAWMKEYFPAASGVTLSVYLIGDKSSPDEVQEALKYPDAKAFAKLAEDHGGKLVYLPGQDAARQARLLLSEGDAKPRPLAFESDHLI
eukprot:g12951.t1